MRTILWFVDFWAYQVFSVFIMAKYIILGKITSKEKQKEYLEKIITNWAKHMVEATKTKVEVVGLENVPKDNVLYVSNHQGSFDIPLLLGYIPKLKGFVAKTELKKTPMVSKWMKEIGCIFLDRDNIKQSLNAIIDGIEKLKNGSTLVIFPEGTRSKCNEISSFKKGSMKLGTKSNAIIVPITIDGSYKIYEEQNKIVSTEVKIYIHKAIDTKSLTKEDKENINEIIYDIIKQPLQLGGKNEEL